MINKSNFVMMLNVEKKTPSVRLRMILSKDKIYFNKYRINYNNSINSMVATSQKGIKFYDKRNFLQPYKVLMTIVIYLTNYERITGKRENRDIKTATVQT